MHPFVADPKEKNHTGGGQEGCHGRSSSKLSPADCNLLFHRSQPDASSVRIIRPGERTAERRTNIPGSFYKPRDNLGETNTLRNKKPTTLNNPSYMPEFTRANVGRNQSSWRADEEVRDAGPQRRKESMSSMSKSDQLSKLCAGSESEESPEKSMEAPKSKNSDPAQKKFYHIPRSRVLKRDPPRLALSNKPLPACAEASDGELEIIGGPSDDLRPTLITVNGRLYPQAKTQSQKYTLLYVASKDWLRVGKNMYCCLKGEEYHWGIGDSLFLAIKKDMVNAARVSRSGGEVCLIVESERRKTAYLMHFQSPGKQICQKLFGGIPCETKSAAYFDNLWNHFQQHGGRRAQDRPFRDAAEPSKLAKKRSSDFATSSSRKRSVDDVENPLPDDQRKTRRRTKLESERGNGRYLRSRPDLPEPVAPKPKRNLPPWKSALVWPRGGKKPATVERMDLDRLEDEQFLNDNLINFYLRYLEEQLPEISPELAPETHFFNTFFYERLSAKNGDKQATLRSLMKWTARVNLFEKKYVIVPINENAHWYLAIITNLCNVRRSLEIDQEMSTPTEEMPVQFTKAASDTTMADAVDGEFVQVPTTASEQILREASDRESRADITEPSAAVERGIIDLSQGSSDVVSHKKIRASEATGTRPRKITPSRSHHKEVDPNTPAIFILDSLGSQHPTTLRALRGYLEEEARNNRNLEFDAKHVFECAYAKVLEQNNSYNCGVYLLYFVRKFLERPAEFTREFLCRERNLDNFDLSEIEGMRDELRALILRLKEEQDSQVEVPKSSSDGSAKTQVEPSGTGDPANKESVESGAGGNFAVAVEVSPLAADANAEYMDISQASSSAGPSRGSPQEDVSSAEDSAEDVLVDTQMTRSVSPPNFEQPQPDDDTPMHSAGPLSKFI